MTRLCCHCHGTKNLSHSGLHTPNLFQQRHSPATCCQAANQGQLHWLSGQVFILVRHKQYAADDQISKQLGPLIDRIQGQIQCPFGLISSQIVWSARHAMSVVVYCCSSYPINLSYALFPVTHEINLLMFSLQYSPFLLFYSLLNRIEIQGRVVMRINLDRYLQYTTNAL